MIERHYFRNQVRLFFASFASLIIRQLVKSFDFEFGFCIPGSVNTWDAVYSVPALSEDLSKILLFSDLLWLWLLHHWRFSVRVLSNCCVVEDMLNNPYETQSDSFYFVDNQLIMHNKASYKVEDPIFSHFTVHIVYSRGRSTSEEELRRQIRCEGGERCEGSKSRSKSRQSHHNRGLLYRGRHGGWYGGHGSGSRGEESHAKRASLI